MGTPIAHRTIPFSIVFPSLRYLHDNAELEHSFPRPVTLFPRVLKNTSS